MNLYIAPAKLFAAFIEIEGNLGFFPILKITTYDSEILVDLPYTQIVFTAGRKLTSAWKPDNDRPDRSSLEDPERVAKD